MTGSRPEAELIPVKEALWRAAEWSAVMAALCYLFLWSWVDPAGHGRARAGSVGTTGGPPSRPGTRAN